VRVFVLLCFGARERGERGKVFDHDVWQKKQRLTVIRTRDMLLCSKARCGFSLECPICSKQSGRV